MHTRRAMRSAVSVLSLFGMLTLGLVLLSPRPALGVDEASLDDLVITPQDNAVLQWNATTLQAIRDTSPAPPVVARALAITHTAIFDAWAAYDHKAVGTRLGASLRRPPAEQTQANKREAVSYAAYRALADLFPSRLADFEARLRALGYDPANSTTDPATPAGVGNTVAAALLAFRHNDGSNQLGNLAPGAYADYTGYRPVNTPDVLTNPSRWQPLRLPTGVEQRFSVPHWGLVTPFALRSGS